jgi:uncharacterized protein YciI
MPHFVLTYDTVDGFVEKRAPFRAEHLRLVTDAHARGDIVMAGAVGEPPESALLVFRGASGEAAERFAAADPYVVNGLVRRWLVRPWNVVVGP